MLKYTQSETLKRARPRGERKQAAQVYTKYFMPITRDGAKKQVQVCQKAFLDSLGFKKKRVQRICRDHFLTGEMVQENRSSDHRSHKYETQRNAVNAYIVSGTSREPLL